MKKMMKVFMGQISFFSLQKISNILLILGLILNIFGVQSINAQIPIVYYSFENPSNRATFVNGPQLDINGTATAFTRAGSSTTINSAVGAGRVSTNVTPLHNQTGATDGLALNSSTFTNATTDPTTSATNYFQFSFSSAGFTGVSLNFDLWTGTTTASYPYYGIIYSVNGGAWTADLTGSNDNGNSIWRTVSRPAIAAWDNANTVSVRIYFFYSDATSAGQVRLDNVTVLATGMANNAGTKTSLDEQAIWSSLSSTTTTGFLNGRTNFTVTSGSTLNLGGGLFITGTFTVNSGGTLDCGSSAPQALNGTGTFTLTSGGNLVVRRTDGITAAIGTATGCIQTTTARNFNAGGNYTFAHPSGTAMVTGTGLPASLTGNLTINNSGGVTLTQATSLGASSILNLNNGILTTTATNLLSITNTAVGAISGGSTTAFVNGPLRRTLPANLSSSASAYNFPVGKGGTYYPFSLTTLTTGATAPVISVEAFNTAPTGTADGTTLNSLGGEHWSTSIVSGNYTNGSVSLTRQTALGVLNRISRSATNAALSYSSLGGTVSGTSINNSNLMGAALGFFALGYSCIAVAPTLSTITNP